MHSTNDWRLLSFSIYSCKMMNMSILLLIPLLLLGWLLSACGSQSIAGNTPQTTATPHVTTTVPAQTPTIATQTTPLPTPAPTSSPVNDTQGWKIYVSPYFTICYPGNWIVRVTRDSDIYEEEVSFNPPVSELIYFSVKTMKNGQVSPDTLLQNELNELLAENSRVESKSKVTISQLTWSTAIVYRPRTQIEASRIKIAYANHLHPYRISFKTRPDQFDANKDTLNAMFQTFQEKL